MGDVARGCPKLWDYVAGKGSEDWEEEYLHMEQTALRLMKPGGPLEHLSKEQVTWEQVQAAQKRRRRPRKVEDQPGMEDGVCNAAQGRTDEFHINQGAAAAEQQGVAGSSGGIIDDDLEQQKKRQRTEPTLSDAVTPEQLLIQLQLLLQRDELTSDLLSSKPLATWDQEKLDSLSKSINDKYLHLHRQCVKLVKSYKDYKRNAERRGAIAKEALKKLMAELVTALGQDEIGQVLLGVLVPQLLQIEDEAEGLVKKLVTGQEQKERNRQMVSLQQQILNLRNCAQVVGEAMNMQCLAAEREVQPQPELPMPLAVLAVHPPDEPADLDKEVEEEKEDQGQAAVRPGAADSSKRGWWGGGGWGFAWKK